MHQPVTKHTLPQGGPTVATFGGGRDTFASALLFIKASGREAHALVRPPSGPGQPGFKQIVEVTKNFEVEADGLVVPRHSAVLIYSRDCPIVTLYETTKQRTVVYHAGRPALTSYDRGDVSVTDIALRIAAPQLSARVTTLAHIAASICPACFPHEGPDAAVYLKHFRAHYPTTITDPGGHLDLPRVIGMELHEWGVLPRHITHDGVCTKEHPGLASHRNGDKESNITVILTN